MILTVSKKIFDLFNLKNSNQKADCIEIIFKLTGQKVDLPNFFWEIEVPLARNRQLKTLTVIFSIESTWLPFIYRRNILAKIEKEFLAKLYTTTISDSNTQAEFGNDHNSVA